MDKQKEIEKMLEKIKEYFPNCRDFCKQGKKCFIKNGLADCINCTISVALLNAGYGDVRAAVKEFAESVKMAFYYEFDELIPSTMADKIGLLSSLACLIFHFEEGQCR